jgi:hypothetical protein
MQYRVRRPARVDGQDYAPGELIRNPGALHNPRNLISARILEVVEGDGAVSGPALELVAECEQEDEATANTDEVTIVGLEAGEGEQSFEPETFDPLGELSNEEFDRLTPQAKGARTRKARATSESEDES